VLVAWVCTVVPLRLPVGYCQLCVKMRLARALPVKVKRRLGFADGAGPDSPQTARRHYPGPPVPCALGFSKTPRRLNPNLKVNLGPRLPVSKFSKLGFTKATRKAAASELSCRSGRVGSRLGQVYYSAEVFGP
jgi:hypothetical protein